MLLTGAFLEVWRILSLSRPTILMPLTPILEDEVNKRVMKVEERVVGGRDRRLQKPATCRLSGRIVAQPCRTFMSPPMKRWTDECVYSRAPKLG